MSWEHRGEWLNGGRMWLISSSEDLRSHSRRARLFGGSIIFPTAIEMSNSFDRTQIMDPQATHLDCNKTKRRETPPSRRKQLHCPIRNGSKGFKLVEPDILISFRWSYCQSAWRHGCWHFLLVALLAKVSLMSLWDSQASTKMKLQNN